GTSSSISECRDVPRSQAIAFVSEATGFPFGRTPLHVSFNRDLNHVAKEALLETSNAKKRLQGLSPSRLAEPKPGSAAWEARNSNNPYLEHMKQELATAELATAIYRAAVPSTLPQTSLSDVSHAWNEHKNVVSA